MDRSPTVMLLASCSSSFIIFEKLPHDVHGAGPRLHHHQEPPFPASPPEFVFVPGLIEDLQEVLICISLIDSDILFLNLFIGRLYFFF